MNRAAFADEARAEFLKNRIDIYEDLPEAVSVFAIVGGMGLVQSEANRARNFYGHGPEFDCDAERMESGREFRVEFGDGAGHEAEGAGFAKAGGDVERVGDEIESDFEGSIGVGNRGGG